MKPAIRCLSFLVVIANAVVFAENNSDKSQLPLDGTKGRAEAPVKHVLTKYADRIREAPVQPNEMVGAEDFMEAVLATGEIGVPKEHLVAKSYSNGEFTNPKVKPGDVNWHADFETACNVSRKSGKPVLLFQMMGNLDDRFC